MGITFKGGSISGNGTGVVVVGEAGDLTFDGTKVDGNRHVGVLAISGSSVAALHQLGLPKHSDLNVLTDILQLAEKEPAATRTEVIQQSGLLERLAGGVTDFTSFLANVAALADSSSFSALIQAIRS